MECRVVLRSVASAVYQHRLVLFGASRCNLLNSLGCCKSLEFRTSSRKGRPSNPNRAAAEGQSRGAGLLYICFVAGDLVLIRRREETRPWKPPMPSKHYNTALPLTRGPSGRSAQSHRRRVDLVDHTRGQFHTSTWAGARLGSDRRQLLQRDNGGSVDQPAPESGQRADDERFRRRSGRRIQLGFSRSLPP